MTQTQHTARDWYISGVDFQAMIINEYTGDLIAVCYSPQKGAETAQANAAFIVKACNAYDKMLAFIETVADGDFPNFVSTIQTEAFELLKKVRG